tara:strand:- start:2585 stop:3022 length:438 start_codon:yes stop_codon:yes gene_type:complete
MEISMKRTVKENIYNQIYNRKFKWFNDCVYCGEKATELDHVMPLDVVSKLDTTDEETIDALGQGLSLVPSCSECNRMAGAEPFDLIRDKREYVQNKIRKKYAKYLNQVHWEDWEIDELGPNMKQEVTRSLKLKKITQLRITFPHN